MNAPERIAPPVDRSRFLGGSDAAAVMGLSPWSTPVQLWLEKTGQRVREETDEQRERRFNRGKKLEPFIVEMVIDKLREQGHAVELLARNERYIDPEHDFLACEIDFELLLDGEHVNGDAKSVHGFARNKWGDEQTDEVPIEYAAQFMHGLMITGRQRCLVAALIGLDDVAIYWVNRDDETIAGMRAREVAFWQRCVVGGETPDPIEFDDITALYPLDNGQAIEASDEIAVKVREFIDTKAEIKALEERREQLELDIAEFISPHAVLTYGGKTIATWKGQTWTGLDQKRLAAERPDVKREYSITKPIRVLRTPKEK